MKTVLETLALSTNYFKEKGIGQARRQAEELLCDALELDRVKLYCDFERPLTEKELNLCRERLTRRADLNGTSTCQRRIFFLLLNF